MEEPKSAGGKPEIIVEEPTDVNAIVCGIQAAATNPDIKDPDWNSGKTEPKLERPYDASECPKFPSGYDSSGHTDDDRANSGKFE